MPQVSVAVSPLLTFVIPVYNTASYLDRFLGSIYEQGEVSYEVLLFDDGFTDGSAEICDSHAVRHKSTFVWHTSNLGISNARNVGLDEAKGHYIWLVDSDDVLVPGALKNIARPLFSQPQMIVFPEIQEDASGQQIGMLDAPSSDQYAEDGAIRCGDNMYPHSRIFSRNLCEGERFNTRLRLLEDRDFVYRICEHITGQVCVLENPLYLYPLSRPDSALNSLPVEDFVKATVVHVGIIRHEIEAGRPYPAYQQFVDFSLGVLALVCRTDRCREKFDEVRNLLLKYDQFRGSLADILQLKYILCKDFFGLLKLAYRAYGHAVGDNCG